jgi:hypothetical protein
MFMVHKILFQRYCTELHLHLFLYQQIKNKIIMKTYALCPISDKKINERVARLNAIFTFSLLILFIITSKIFVISFLLIDFALRSAELSQYSPLAILSRNILKLFNIKPKLVNAGPKIFAARIGVAFSFGVLLSTAFGGWNIVGISLISLFGVCAFLEGVFGLCVACQIYPFVYKLFYHTKLVGEK